VSRHGKHRQRRRGCHKRDTSPEVVRWKADHLLSDRTGYMDQPTYAQLARLHRGMLEDRP
jgi:hypothetical protein